MKKLNGTVLGMEIVPTETKDIIRIIVWSACVSAVTLLGSGTWIGQQSSIHPYPEDHPRVIQVLETYHQQIKDLNNRVDILRQDLVTFQKLQREIREQQIRNQERIEWLMDRRRGSSQLLRKPACD